MATVGIFVILLVTCLYAGRAILLPVVAAVVTGTYEMSSTNTLSICTAHVRDIPISIVAPEIVYTPRSPPVRLGGSLLGTTASLTRGR